MLKIVSVVNILIQTALIYSYARPGIFTRYISKLLVRSHVYQHGR